MNDSTLKLRLENIPQLVLDLGIGEITKVRPFNNRTISKTSKFLIETQRDNFLIKFYEDGRVPRFLNFLFFLNSVNFPTPELITRIPIVSLGGVPFIVYSFIRGEEKSFLTGGELREFSQLLARLHSESDNFYEGGKHLDYGLTHGDLNLTNIIYNEKNQPLLIDFDNVNIRNYISDITSFLFFNTFSDLSSGSIDIEQAQSRGCEFIKEYSSSRRTRFSKKQLSQSLRHQAEQFLDHSRQQFKDGKICEQRVYDRTNIASKIINLF